MSTGVAFEVPESVNLDEPPTIPDTGDSVQCQKPGCDQPITKPARGRTPKFCDAHKDKAPRINNKSSLSGKSWPKATEIETLLTQYVEGLGFAVMLANADDGTVIQEKAPAVVHELVELAKDDIRLRKYLEWVATPGKYAPLTMACFSLVFPILQNHGIVGKFFDSVLAGKG